MDRILSEAQYADFSENDFLADPFFQEYILKPTSATEAFWFRFLKNYPDKKDKVEQAGKLLRNLSFKEQMPTDELVKQSWQKHLSKIQSLSDDKVIRIDKAARWKKALRIAAIMGGVVLLAAILFWADQQYSHRNMAIATDFGELDSLVLPDQSRVVLNANSTIRYSKQWEKGLVREVWLEGEAFFDVKHLNQNKNNISSHERFLVHTDDVDIEVLGTSFNIRKRRGKTEVVLQTGKVKLHFRESSRDDLEMNPGDIVVYDPSKKLLNKSVVQVEEYTAWKEKKLILHNPTVYEIVSYLEDNYGKRIFLQTKDLGKRQLDGPIPLNNLDDALFILSTVYNMEVIRNADSTIVLRTRH